MLELGWAWALTNQQGYTDGIRSQFGTGENGVIVEFVVTAWRFETFMPTLTLAPSNKPLQTDGVAAGTSCRIEGPGSAALFAQKSHRHRIEQQRSLSGETDHAAFRSNSSSSL
jgi:hypothetical protein